MLILAHYKKQTKWHTRHVPRSFCINKALTKIENNSLNILIGW